MPTNRPYTVRLLSPVPARTTATDITSYIFQIEKMTDTDQDSPQSAQITMNTIDGAFVTETNGGNTPLLQQYAELEITLTDDAGREFRRIMILDETMPDESEAGGHLTKYLLYGREYYLKQVRISGHDFFTTHRNMITRIIAQYNESKQPNQPTIELSMDGVPSYPVNIWRWGEATSAYDALVRVIEGLAAPTKVGGASEYFTMRFTEHASDKGKLTCEIFQMGSKRSAAPEYMLSTTTAAPPGTVLRGQSPNTLHTARTYMPLRGNTVVVRGADDTGRLPVEVAEYSAITELYNRYPLHVLGVEYSAGAYVRTDWYRPEPVASMQNRAGQTPLTIDNQYDPDGKVYRAKQRVPALDSSDNPIPLSNTTYWELRHVRDELGDNNGSPWTSDLEAVKSFCGNRESAPSTGTILPTSFAVPDSNLVVKDGREYRNWAHVRCSDPRDIPEDFLYDDNVDRGRGVPSPYRESRLPEGFRVLVVTPPDNWPQPTTKTYRFYQNPHGVVNGLIANDSQRQKDPFGIPYHHSIAQWRAGQWIVIRSPDEWNECAVLSEGLVYMYGNKEIVANPFEQRSDDNPDATWAWRSLLSQSMGNDCFHYPTRVENTDGLTYRYKKTGGNPPTHYTDDRAILWEYQYGAPDQDSTWRLWVRIAGAIGNLVVEMAQQLGGTEMYRSGWWLSLIHI